MPMKNCVHSFRLVCHLLLKTLMLPAKAFSVPLTVRYQVFYTCINDFCWLLGIIQLTKLNSADSLQLDRDACGNLDSMIVPSCGELRELKSGHHHKVVEITDHAGQCLSQEYMVRTSRHMIENLYFFCLNDIIHVLAMLY